MCTGATVALGMQAAGAVGSTYASYRGSQLAKQGYEYQSAVARNNAQLAEWQAQDAITRGQSKEGDVRLRTAQLAGTQRAIFGARNIAMNEGSALNILADTAFMGERDALTVRNNAQREAWAARNQARGYDSNAAFLSQRASAESPFLSAAGTLLTTGGKVASGWYSMRERSQNTSGAWTGYDANRNGWDY